MHILFKQVGPWPTSWRGSAEILVVGKFAIDTFVCSRLGSKLASATFRFDLPKYFNL